ncbi:hypothetical protein SBA1_370004 [Candidatus Sulfotelmatobacter kueseliae]|jgi:hypothetical protein|uniref:Uncharacterized protein n=1 Tax=Candidatus Sulfotelmatobacter kueseliae TaxID=2042962 RepID=A0A2U3KPL5_9BACT|nr:hypothetical protein SBA1_370004 [Candidatus Sulfotelmatobacter kueseliae]
MTPSMRWSCRVYATLLLLYPSTLRRQFGQEMIEVFADQMRDACQTDGWVGGMGVWSCVGREVLRTALCSHLQVIGISFVSGLTALGLLCTFFWATFAPH